MGRIARCCCQLGLPAWLICSHGAAEPRKSTAYHAVYVEGLGAATFWSVNYEVRPLSMVSLRAGYGVVPYSDDGKHQHARHSFPVMAFVLFGGSENLLELGAGPTYVASSGGERTNMFGSIAIGYRYQPRTGGTFFRFSFTPLVGPAILPWIGVSLGATF